MEVGFAANEIKNRSIFQTLINQNLQEDDVLMVIKIDHCNRNTLEFLKLQEHSYIKKELDLLYSNDMSINK